MASKKAAAYGDEEMPEELDDAEDLAAEIEEFVEAVEEFVARSKS